MVTGGRSPAPRTGTQVLTWPCPDCQHVIRCGSEAGLEAAKRTHPTFCPKRQPGT